MTPGSGAGGFVGLAAAPATALAGALAAAATELDARRARIEALLHRAGEPSGAAGPAAASAASWARSQSADLRWRIAAVGADPAGVQAAPLRLAVLAFPDRAAMLAAATADVARLRRLTDRGDRLRWRVGDKDLRRRALALRRELAAADRRAAADPGYAAAFIEGLGADGTRRLLDLVRHTMVDQSHRGRGRDDGLPPGENAVRDLAEPFDRILATATRARTAGVAAVEAALLAPRTIREYAHLNLVLLAGRADPAFTASAAAVLLADRRRLSWGVAADDLGPWPDVSVPQLTATQALGRDPEAAFRFVVGDGNGPLLLRLEEYPPFPAAGRPRLRESAAHVLELALADWPASHPGRREAARDAFDQVAAAAGSGGLSAPVRRSLAAVSTRYLDGLTAVDVDGGAVRLPRPALTAFFGEIARDDRALAVLSLGIGAYAQQELRSGLRQVMAARYDHLPHQNELGDEVQRVSELYGAVGAGLAGVERSAGERAAALAGGVRHAADAATALGMAAAGLGGPAGVAVGVGAGALVDLVARAVESGARYRGPVSQQYVESIVRPALERLVVDELYRNPETRRALGIVEPPPDRLGGGGIAFPGPAATATERSVFAAWYAEWMGLAGNSSLRGTTATFAQLLTAPVVERLLLASVPRSR